MTAVIWPETAENLKVAGYRAACYGSCRSCGARVLWARTPAGKLMPLIEKRVATHVYYGGGKGEWVEVLTFKPHFADCPQADLWRESGQKAANAE